MLENEVPKDFSFVGEHRVGALYHLFGFKDESPISRKNGAISFICMFDEIEGRKLKLT